MVMAATAAAYHIEDQSGPDTQTTTPCGRHHAPLPYTLLRWNSLMAFQWPTCQSIIVQLTHPFWR